MSVELEKVKKIENIREYQLADNTCEVYFLFYHNELQYIGRTTNMQQRLASHRHQRKTFDKVYHFTAVKKEVASIEKRYIKMFKPPLNKRK